MSANSITDLVIKDEISDACAEVAIALIRSVGISSCVALAWALVAVAMPAVSPLPSLFK